jgi:peroxiredoxin Q/BCP
VVVLAFYPKDRTGGCTAELSKFRDEFATLFGDGVTVLPVSLDGVASHAGWAADMRLPFGLVADSSGAIAARYGSIDAGKPYANRTVFVVGRDGRVAWRELRFGALDEHAYQALAGAVAAARQR